MGSMHIDATRLRELTMAGEPELMEDGSTQFRPFDLWADVLIKHRHVQHMTNGFQRAGGHLVSGVAKGISGLVTKPLKEARKSGVVGAVKGLGKGVAGLVTKPLKGTAGAVKASVHGLRHSMFSHAHAVKSASIRLELTLQVFAH